MARPVTIREETIIEAARAVFLERGIRATAAEVADRAGISEGSIFKRFKTKADLFQTAMKLRNDDDPPFLRGFAALVGKADIRANLLEMGSQIVDFMEVFLPLAMMSWSNPEKGPYCCEPNPMALRILRAMAGYFEAEMRIGRLRRLDAEIVARTFLGSIHNYVAFQILFRSEDELPLPKETFLRGLTSLLWTGLEPALMNASVRSAASAGLAFEEATPPSTRTFIQATVSSPASSAPLSAPSSTSPAPPPISSGAIVRSQASSEADGGGAVIATTAQKTTVQPNGGPSSPHTATFRSATAHGTPLGPRSLDPPTDPNVRDGPASDAI